MTARWLLAIGAGLAAMAAMPAHAEILIYKLTGAYTASWTIDTATAPDPYVAGDTATFKGLTGLFPDPNDPSIIYAIAEICFFGPAYTGFEIDENGNNANHYLEVSGDDTIPGNRLVQFDDSSGQFTLLTGEFDLVRYDSIAGENDYATTYHLSVNAAPPAVPEPQSWALTIGGLGLAGAMLRRPRRTRIATRSA